MSTRRQFGLAVALVGALVLSFVFLPVDRWGLELARLIQGAGALGSVIYAAVYVLAALFFLPESLLTLVAGFAYGPLWGTLPVSPLRFWACCRGPLAPELPSSRDCEARP